MGFFCPKYVMLQLKIFRGVMFVDTGGVMQSFEKKTDKYFGNYLYKYVNFMWEQVKPGKVVITCDFFLE